MSNGALSRMAATGTVVAVGGSLAAPARRAASQRPPRVVRRRHRARPRHDQRHLVALDVETGGIRILTACSTPCLAGASPDTHPHRRRTRGRAPDQYPRRRDDRPATRSPPRPAGLVARRHPDRLRRSPPACTSSRPTARGCAATGTRHPDSWWSRRPGHPTATPSRTSRPAPLGEAVATRKASCRRSTGSSCSTSAAGSVQEDRDLGSLHLREPGAGGRLESRRGAGRVHGVGGRIGIYTVPAAGRRGGPRQHGAGGHRPRVAARHRLTSGGDGDDRDRGHRGEALLQRAGDLAAA